MQQLTPGQRHDIVWARSQFTQEEIDSYVPTDEDIEEMIVNWKADSLFRFPQATIDEWRADYEAKLAAAPVSDEERERIRRRDTANPDNVHMLVARRLYRQRSEAEARRLGLVPHPEEEFAHSGAVLIDLAIGEEAGIALAAKYGFKYEAPGAMWDTLSTRRDGDALIGFIGDDRGWEKDWKYYIAVAWAPLAVEQRLDRKTYF